MLILNLSHFLRHIHLTRNVTKRMAVIRLKPPQQNGLHGLQVADDISESVSVVLIEYYGLDLEVLGLLLKGLLDLLESRLHHAHHLIRLGRLYLYYAFVLWPG